MTEQNGVLSALQVTERIKASCPRVKILVLSTYQDTAHVRVSLVAGASSYLLKKATSQELLEALRVINNGGVYLDPSIAGQVVAGYIEARKASTEDNDLSPRELEVLVLVAWGYTNMDIAQNLHLSVKTIEGYKAEFGKKLGLTSRAEVMRYALRQGWMSEA